jgi:hypothetical protein
MGRPYDLLQDQNTILYQLVHKLGSDEFNRLLTIAENHLRKNDPTYVRPLSGGALDRTMSPEQAMSPVNI